VAARYVRDKLKPAKVFVVSDDTPYAVALTSNATTVLRDVTVGTAKVAPNQADFGTVVTDVGRTRATVVFFAGTGPAAGTFLKQLRATGNQARLVGGDALSVGFIGIAGAGTADDAIRTDVCLPLDEGKGSFTSAYHRIHPQGPDQCAGYAYDAAKIMLSGIGNGVHDRPGMLDFLNGYHGDGAMGKYRFTGTGDQDPDVMKIGVFRVHNGGFTFVDAVDAG
jgi:branched-chain amino acid transport system substrate-binding protein